MRALLLLLSLWAPPAHAIEPTAWPNPSIAWANTTWPGDYDDHGQPNLRPGRWNLVPLPGAAGATHAMLKGLLVITHGTQAAQCEIIVWWRRPGEPGSAGSYVSQTVSVVPGGGVRTPDTIMVPVKNGYAEMWWDANPAGMPAHPQGCAWGFTYRMQAIVK